MLSGQTYRNSISHRLVTITYPGMFQKTLDTLVLFSGAILLEVTVFFLKHLRQTNPDK